MPMKRRTSKERNLPRITVRAVDLFERGLRLQAQRNQTREFADIAVALGQELGMGPWQADVFDCYKDEPPYWLTERDKVEDYWRSRQIRLELEAALRERRKARRTGASTAATPQSAPPADLPPAA
jgi:hypothetical protein